MQSELLWLRAPAENIHRLRHDHRDAALAGALGVIKLVALRRKAVGRSIIGSHRPHDDAVLQPHGSDYAGLLQELRVELPVVAPVAL